MEESLLESESKHWDSRPRLQESKAFLMGLLDISFNSELKIFSGMLGCQQR